MDCPDLPLVVGDGNAKAVVWPGMGATHRSVHLIDLKRQARTVDLSHESDSVYYVSQGEGVVRDVTTGTASALVDGSMVHIDRGDTYRFEATGAQGMTIVGGPCPADPRLYAHLKPSTVL